VCSAYQGDDLTLCERFLYGLFWPYLWLMLCFFFKLYVVEFSLQPHRHMCLQEMIFVHVCVSDMKVMI
jgi:hypothetical protein